jgi:hypothetical protein
MEKKCNEKLHSLYSSAHTVSLNKRRQQDMKHDWETRHAHKILVEKAYGKGQLERTRCRWEDNIKMELRKIRCEKCELD